MRTSISSMIAAATIPLVVLTASGAESESAGGSAGTFSLRTERLDDLIDDLSDFHVRGGDEVLRDRLAAGILKWQSVKTHNGDKVVIWNECGRRIAKEDVEQVAQEWATNLIRAADNSEKVYGWRINLWGVLGTIANESSFDRCAIGLHTRAWAYSRGMLKAKKGTWISHSKKDILSLVKNKKWQKEWKWVDAGPLQVLWKRIYRGPLEDMLTLNPGLDIGIQEMQRRTSHFQSYGSKKEQRRLYKISKRAWRMWPGAYPDESKAVAYDKKITMFARKMGATNKEI